MKTALLFFFAVLGEVTAKTALKFSEGFTRPLPSVIIIVGSGLSFYLVSLTLEVMSIGVACALRSGVGIVLTIIAALITWQESMDWAPAIGIFLFMAGSLVINLYSSKITR